MRKSVAAILAALMLAACDRDSRPPEQPSPANPPKPTVGQGRVAPLQIALPLRAAPATTLFATPGALPAAERHFELFQQLNADRALLIEARFSREGPRDLRTSQN